MLFFPHRYTTTITQSNFHKGLKIFFSYSTVLIFGALASEIHTISQWHSPDPRTFSKSCPRFRNGVAADKETASATTAAKAAAAVVATAANTRKVCEKDKDP